MRYTFGDYTLDLLRYELCCAGQPLKLQLKVFDLLVYFVQHRDRVVTRQELLAALWPEQFVSDDALERAIAAVRRAVGDSGHAQRVLKTVHGRGYHFVAPVEEHSHDRLANQPLPNPSKTQEAPGNSPGLYPPDGERKQATVLICRLTFPEMPPDGVDPETLHVLRQAFFTLARQEVQSYAGTIEHFVDDGFRAFFGAPVTYEDHPRQAVLAALSMQERLRQQRDDAASLPSGAVRMGLHTGQVIVSPVGDDHRQVILGLGDTTRVAEQLVHQAEPGAIVLSEVTGRAVQQFVRLHSIGPVHGQGTTMPYTAYKALARLPQPALAWQGRRVVRQFVGREYEMATVRVLLAHVEEGRGQVVGIVGEPGIGKSRLLYEFHQHVAGRSLTYLTGRCLAYGQTTPYLLLLDLLRHACGISEQDTAEMMVTKVRQHLQNLAMAPEEWAPYVSHLLGMQEGKERLAALSPQAIRARVFETLLQMNIQTSQHQPLIVAVEDLHWIDPTSEEWLALLVERLAGAPILVLTAYRPGYHPTWMDKSYATQLALQRLTTDESRRLVQAVFHPTMVPESLMHELLTKAGGNPFFLEELAQTVVEHGATYSPLTIPETVQTVLAARMDRLPPGAKHLLQVASVIGTEIPGPLLQVVSGLSDTALQQHLRSLQGMEFLFATRSLPVCAYTFKHALTQEAAYQSLLRRTRQQMHQRTAQMLVEHFAETVATQPEVVAHHYTAAGLGEQAIPYWQQAGERAVARSAHREAVAHLTKGLEVLQTLPETTERARRELGLQLALGPSLIVTRGPGAPEVGQARARARVLCEHVGDRGQLAAVLDGLWYFHTVRGNLQRALELAEELLQLAQRAADVGLHVQAHFGMGLTLFFRGALDASRSHFERALTCAEAQPHGDLARQHGDHDRVVACLSQLAWNLHVLGYPAHAMTRLGEALTRAQELGYPYGQVYALIHAVTIHQHRREARAVQEYAEAMMALCDDQGFAHWLAAGRFYRGWALVAQGRTAEGMVQMRQGLTRASHARGPMGPYTLALWAEACVHRGQPAEGGVVLQQVLAEVDRSEGCFYAAEIYRLQGEFLLSQTAPDTQRAERCLRYALDLARRAQAKWWELRVAMSLCRLWQRQGKRQEAHELLAPVYGWFTEGFDTADLQEARVLLHELQ